MIRTWWSRCLRRLRGASAQRPIGDSRPQLEVLEDRTVPSTVATIRQATGLTPAAIQATVDTFRADLGNPNNGNTPGAQPGGRREINWDGNVAADPFSSPNLLSANFFNQAPLSRGAVFTTPGAGVIVSQDDDVPPDADPDLVRFGDINPTYTTTFQTFSAQRLFSASGSNVVDVNFFVPGTNTPALVRGFGAVFSDVDLAGSSRIEYFDDRGVRIFSQDVLATSAGGTLSFLGVSFTTACVARVRITMGDTALAAGINDVTLNQGMRGGMFADVVVLDDFIYGEPVARTPPRLVVGADSGAPGGHVKVFNGSTGAELASFLAYPGFIGGVRVAQGDVNGDNVPDIITGTGPGAPGGHVKVFDGNTFTQIASFLAFGPGFLGGVFVAAGDVNGDGRDDVIVGSDFGAGHVKVIDATRLNQVLAGGMIAPGAELASFLPFGPTFIGGVNVGVGDVNRDGRVDVLIGTGASSLPHVKAIDATRLNQVLPAGQISDTALLASFLAFDRTFPFGALVTGGDFNGDGFAEIVVGSPLFSGPLTKIVDGTRVGQVLPFGLIADTALQRVLFPFDTFFTNGVRVAAGDLNGDGLADLVTGKGGLGFSLVRTFGSRQLTQLGSSTLADPAILLAFQAFPGFNGGVFVSAS